MHRIIVCLCCFAAACFSVLAHQDRIEQPETLSVSFKTGETVTFTVSSNRITALNVKIGTIVYSIPASECAKLHHVRFESTKLLWNGSYKSAAIADYFYVKFDMGQETARAFGGLPHVEVMFRDGKFSESTIVKKIAQGSWQHRKL